jgi:hypothetical protein
LAAENNVPSHSISPKLFGFTSSAPNTFSRQRPQKGLMRRLIWGLTNVLLNQTQRTIVYSYKNSPKSTLVQKLLSTLGCNELSSMTCNNPSEILYSLNPPKRTFCA